MKNNFNCTSFFHVGRKLNMEFNSLFEDGLHIEVGLWTMLESKDGSVQEFWKSMFSSYFF
jgi:hypothetical protein